MRVFFPAVIRVDDKLHQNCMEEDSKNQFNYDSITIQMESNRMIAKIHFSQACKRSDIINIETKIDEEFENVLNALWLFIIPMYIRSKS